MRAAPGWSSEGARVGASQAGARAGHVTTKPIEQIEVGQRVVTDLDAETRALATGPIDQLPSWDHKDVDPIAWRRIDLVRSEEAGGRCEITLLRPQRWIDETGAEVGGTIELSLPEQTIEGPAQVVSIGPCPPIPSGRGHVVTGTFAHVSSRVLQLHFSGMSEPLGVTGNHPIYSVDRAAFVAAEDLKPGERVEHLTATARLVKVERLPGEHRVYNLEVHGEHVYRVASLGILVHNQKLSDAGHVKPVNLPSWRRTRIDMDHIGSGHMIGGSRVSPKKDLFPASWSIDQVENAIRQAYRGAKRIRTQGDRVLVQGEACGRKIEMWVNTKEGVIETAYPIKILQ
jgi:hypothetical protein